MFDIINSIEINHRHDFGLLANARGCRVAVEVGTDQAVFARQFLHNFNGELVCVDPFEAYDELPGTRVPDLLAATLALMPWHGRFRILQMSSEAAAADFPWWQKDRIDFVHIDGCHQYDAVRADLHTWWPLLTDQGIFAGHDFDDTHPGVVQAVTEFAKALDKTIRVVAGDHPESWYIYKTEPPKLRHFFFQGGESVNPHHAL